MESDPIFFPYKMNALIRIFVFVLSITAGTAFGEDCCRVTKELQCLRTNFSYCYLNHYERFSEILNRAEEQARRCKSLKDTARFLALVEIDGGNAEFNEYLDQTIEELCIATPKCFVSATKHLSQSTREIIVRRLHNPTFYDEKELVKGCLTELKEYKE